MHAALPVDPWRLVSRRFSDESVTEAETLFATANGYMGIRGTHDEGLPSNDPAFFLNGFHETWPIPYGEAAFGFATTGQTIVSAPDGSVIRLYVDEEPLVLSESKLLDYERVLDMRAGILDAPSRSGPPAARSSRCARSASCRCNGATWRRSPTRSRCSPAPPSSRSRPSSSPTCRGRRATTIRASACAWPSPR